MERVFARPFLRVLCCMADVTRILSEIEEGDPQAADRLLPLIYQELRNLAASKLANEKPGQTLQATALVHEAYLRLVGVEKSQVWNSRGHFFAAAAEAMRRILIEKARRKKQCKAGGDLKRIELDDAHLATNVTPDELLTIDEALSQLEHQSPEAARLFKLRYFAGCSVEEGAKLLDISRATAYRHWRFARAWLLSQLGPNGGEPQV